MARPPGPAQAGVPRWLDGRQAPPRRVTGGDMAASDGLAPPLLWSGRARRASPRAWRSRRASPRGPASASHRDEVPRCRAQTVLAVDERGHLVDARSQLPMTRALRSVGAAELRAAPGYLVARFRRPPWPSPRPRRERDPDESETRRERDQTRAGVRPDESETPASEASAGRRGDRAPRSAGSGPTRASRPRGLRPGAMAPRRRKGLMSPFDSRAVPQRPVSAPRSSSAQPRYGSRCTRSSTARTVRARDEG
jgi:hypothetical protein